MGITAGDFSLDMSLRHWINDGLMTIFFFVVGLEVKRELVVGELQGLRKAALPIAGAVGGMLLPAGIYLLLQVDGQARQGWGIPMATDIAFVVGILALLRDRIPKGLRVMLLSLAIADDIGAILVIAVGYTRDIDLVALVAAVGGITLVMALFFLGICNLGIYVLIMVLVWFAVHQSGIHATIAGVIFGMLTPTRSWVAEGRLKAVVERALCLMRGQEWSNREERYETLRNMERATRKTISPQERFEKELHVWSAFVIMPLFALANAGVAVRFSDFTDPVALAVAGGLVLGKPIGIVAASAVAVALGVARLPEGVSWPALVVGGCLAGIGFTMSLFIAGLALGGDQLAAAKVGILGASVLSAIIGAALLLAFSPKNPS